MPPEDNAAANRARVSWRTIGFLVGIAICLAGIGWLISTAAGTTLGYVKALAWPAVVLLIAVLFRHPLVALFRDRSLEELAVGPVRARIGARQTEQSEQDDRAIDGLLQLVRHEAEEAGEEWDDVHVAPEIDEEATAEYWLERFLEAHQEAADAQAELASRDDAIELLRLLLEIFAVQLRFLRHLSAAPNGLTRAAAEAWYEEEQKRSPALRNWPFEGAASFMNFLLRNDLVNILDDGGYVLASKGDHLISLDDTFWYAEKAF